MLQVAEGVPPQADQCSAPPPAKKTAGQIEKETLKSQALAPRVADTRNLTAKFYKLRYSCPAGPLFPSVISEKAQEIMYRD